jgi:GT2 family glycosyltransferase
VLPRHQDWVLSWADFVPQETLFWRRRLWERVGGKLDEEFQFAMDWELLLRFREAGARLVRLPRFLGLFRHHEAQKTHIEIGQRGAVETARLRLKHLGKEPSPAELRVRLFWYGIKHLLCHWLHRLGIFW